MKIEVLGTGCAKCHSLVEHAREAAQTLGVDFELTHVTELDEMIRRGVVSTPALMIDGTLYLSGRSASAKELEKLLRRSQAR